MSAPGPDSPREVRLDAAGVALEGTLTSSTGAPGLVVFAHGSGSGRHSPRNRAVAQALNHAGLATLLFDLLTGDEEYEDRHSRRLRFDVPLLAERLAGAVDWARARPDTAALPIGLFGASTGAAAALVTAAGRPDDIGAVVSRGGRVDLAGDVLDRVRAPTLMIVGEHDDLVHELNEQAAARMTCAHALEVVGGATHLFEELGALDRVAALAAAWFRRHLNTA